MAAKKPLSKSLLPPLVVPPQPVAASQDEFDRLSSEAQAAILFSWSDFWFRPTPAIAPMSGTPIVMPAPSTDGETRSTAGWKQAPTTEERESICDDWKKY